jgi:twitching motility two-component system response regulator PilH
MARILVIDDERSVAHVMRLLLEQRGHEVVVADDGSRGLALAQRQTPDVILLDLMMPIMDGFATLQALRSNVRTAPIPVVIVTALQPEQVEQRCYSLGARAYVRKPFDAGILIGTVEDIVAPRNAASLDRGAGLPEHSATHELAESPVSMPALEGRSDP